MASSGTQEQQKFNYSPELQQIIQGLPANFTNSSSIKRQEYLTLKDLVKLADTDRKATLVTQIKSKLTYWRSYYLIGRSSYFDAAWYNAKYLESNPEENPLEHFIKHGAELGFDPSVKFSTKYYLKRYLDVKRSNINPLLHFILRGQQEGRCPRPELEVQELNDEDSVQITFPASCSSIEQRNSDPVFQAPCCVHLHCSTLESYLWVQKACTDLPAGSLLLVATTTQDLAAKIKVLLEQGNSKIAQQIMLSVFPQNPLLSLFMESSYECSNYQHICHLHDQLPEHPLLARRPAFHDLVQTLLGSANSIYCVRNLLEARPDLALLRAKPMLPYLNNLDLFWITGRQVKELAPHFEQNRGSVVNFRADQLNTYLENLLSRQNLGQAEFQGERAYWLANYHSKKRPYQGLSKESLKKNIGDYQSRKHPANKTVIYTAITDQYDQLKLPEYLDPTFDYVCFSNHSLNGYGVFNVQPIDYKNIDPVKVARFVKMHPHTLLKKYTRAIWVDSNLLIRGDLEKYFGLLEQHRAPIGLVPHPCRETLVQEALACTNFTIQSNRSIAHQITSYPDEILQAPNLHETGLIVFDLQHPTLNKFLEIWWSQIELYTSRDQLSLGYALSKTNLKVAPLMTDYQNVRNSPDFVYFEHGLENGYSYPVGHTDLGANLKPNC